MTTSRSKPSLGPAILAFRKSYDTGEVTAEERQRELDALAAFPREKVKVADAKSVKDRDKDPAYLAMPALREVWRGGR